MPTLDGIVLAEWIAFQIWPVLNPSVREKVEPYNI